MLGDFVLVPMVFGVFWQSWDGGLIFQEQLEDGIFLGVKGLHEVMKMLIPEFVGGGLVEMVGVVRLHLNYIK